ncbi:MAG: DUF177 domain-containing protein [Ruminococcus sp.]|uniref:YceD family protein n=1 Tax=Ruminococcus sp. TaxID=41978 RepID=UPI002873D7DF|nr:DUF177 domain-containing protein [Ruminococcus sp.]MBQ3285525.1 DUF177 domain-containing protein [Ruminococcus sp.]
MLLDLKDIFVSDGSFKDVSYTLSLSDVEISGEHPFNSPVEIRAHAENKAGMVTLDIDASFTYHTSCDRCLVPIERQFDYHFSHKLIEALEEDFNDDYIEAPDLTVDLDELASSDILLELPTKFLCRGDCQGLCQKCGHNLNLGDCGCDKTEIDPRLEALKALLN